MILCSDSPAMGQGRPWAALGLLLGGVPVGLSRSTSQLGRPRSPTLSFFQEWADIRTWPNFCFLNSCVPFLIESFGLGKDALKLNCKVRAGSRTPAPSWPSGHTCFHVMQSWNHPVIQQILTEHLLGARLCSQCRGYSSKLSIADPCPPSWSLFFKIFIYLFLAALGLHCFLSQLEGSRAVAQCLWCMGFVAPWDLPGPGIESMLLALAGRFLITNQWTTREVHGASILK